LLLKRVYIKNQNRITQSEKNYDSSNKVGNQTYFAILYEGSRNAESKLRKKPLIGPKYIDADIKTNILEEDDKNSYEDKEGITDDNFDESSRKENA